MWECLADGWGRKCMEASSNTALLEGYFGAMLMESLECDALHNPNNGRAMYKFFFLDGSILRVMLNRDAICEEAVTLRRTI